MRLPTRQDGVENRDKVYYHKLKLFCISCVVYTFYKCFEQLCLWFAQFGDWQFQCLNLDKFRNKTPLTLDR